MNWQIAYTDRPEKIKNYLSAKEIVDSGIQIMPASVPGCFQADLIKNCIEPDFYYSSNILKNYAYEKHHVWYFSEFDAKDGDYLHFCGIDTVADIIINGKKVMSVNNMFLPYNVSENISEGVNEVIVHIIPAVSAASEYPDFPDYCFAYKYNWESLYIRKAPHMYGWDILPRIITSGIWKPVVIKNKYSYEIDDIHIYTKELSQNHDKAVVSVNAVLPCSFCSAYKVTVSDGLNEFTSEGEVIGENINTEIDIVKSPPLVAQKLRRAVFI